MFKIPEVNLNQLELIYDRMSKNLQAMNAAGAENPQHQLFGYQVPDDAMPGIAEKGEIAIIDAFGEFPKPGDMVVAVLGDLENKNFILRQLGYDSLRATNLEFKEIPLSEVSGLFKVIDIVQNDNKGNL